MGQIFQANARMSQHTLSTSGVTFSVPPVENFTTSLTQSQGLVWDATDLCFSEFGINEADKELFIRMNDEIKGVDVWSVPISGSISAGNLSVNVLQLPIDNSKYYKIDTRISARPISTLDVGGYFYSEQSLVYFVGNTFSVDTTFSALKGPFSPTVTNHTMTGTESFATYSVDFVTLPASTYGLQYKLQYKIWTF